MPWEAASSRSATTFSECSMEREMRPVNRPSSPTSMWVATALILVGRSLQAEDFGESRLYAADYDRRYRPLGTEPRFPATDVHANAALDTARDTLRDVPLGNSAP